MRLYRAMQLMRLRAREWLLAAQIEDKRDLIVSHTRSYDLLCTDLRKCRMKIAQLTPAADMLAEMMRGRI